MQNLSHTAGFLRLLPVFMCTELY